MTVRRAGDAEARAQREYKSSFRRRDKVRGYAVLGGDARVEFIMRMGAAVNGAVRERTILVKLVVWRVRGWVSE